MSDTGWDRKEIVDDPRIDHAYQWVRVAAERLHANESLHMHRDIGDVVCIYCALRASTAIRTFAATPEVAEHLGGRE